MEGLLAHPVSLPRSVPIPHFSRHRAHLECDSWRPLSDDNQFWFGLRSGKMTTHNSQGNGRASPPLALASRVPGNSETEISGHGIAPLLHRAPVLPMPTQHVGMHASICFLSRYNSATLKRHSAAAAILSRHSLLRGLAVVVAEFDSERKWPQDERKANSGQPPLAVSLQGPCEVLPTCLCKTVPKSTDMSTPNEVGRSWRGNSFVIVRHHGSPLQSFRG